MAKKNVTVIFDRQGVVGKTGRGKVEIRVYLAANVRKYIVVGEATKTGWKSYQNSKELQLQVEKYEEVVRAMKLLGEDMTIENFNAHIEVEKKETKSSFHRNFIEFMREEVNREKLRDGTFRHKKLVIETLECYGKIKTFADLSPANIRAFDRWLRDTGERTDVTVWNYHKRIRKYTRMLKLNELIEQDPYDLCKIPHGHNKMRVPLVEEELCQLRKVKLNEKLDRVWGEQRGLPSRQPSASAVIRSVRNVQIQRRIPMNKCKRPRLMEPHGSEELFQRREQIAS